MKILITGGKGMLGRTLQKEFADCDLVIADLPEADITDADGFEAFVAGAAPDAVIHCAAMTQVDKCETAKDLAYKLNVTGSANVAKVCANLGIRLIAISTDYVFRGDGERPYSEYDEAGGSETVYGQTKFEGEEKIRELCPNHVIARIAWLYGAGGPSFVHAMLNLADGTRPVLKVVADQHGNPTSAMAVARQLRNILQHPELTGTFHMTCGGEATWYEFAEEIFRLAGVKQRLQPCTTAEFPRPAKRPSNSKLEKRRLKENNLPAMPDWHVALEEFIRQEFGK